MVDISSFLGDSSLQTERRIHRRTNDMRSCSGATIKHRFLRLDWRERERGKYYMSTYSAPSLATVTAYVRGGDLRSFLQWRETLLRLPSRDGKGQRKKTAAVKRIRLEDFLAFLDLPICMFFLLLLLHCGVVAKCPFLP